MPDHILNKLQDCLHFEELCRLCAQQQAFIVGGAVRDALLDEQITDLDLIMPVDPTPIAREFARQEGGSWFWLDKARLQSRVVFNKEKQAPDYDFAPFRTPDLKGDLSDRDFTINAMAYEVSSTTLHDPCGGQGDLKRRLLRTVTDASLKNDPLRILKGVRHAVTMELEIDSATMKLMAAAVTGLGGVAVERVRQEVWKILGNENAGKGLWLLNECAAGDVLFNADFEKALHAMIAALPAYKERWECLAAIHPPAQLWLEGEIEQGLKLQTLLLFVLLVQKLEPGLPSRVAEKWLLGRKAQAVVAALVSLRSTAFVEIASVARNPRALYWWANSKGVEARILLLYLACCDLAREGAVADIGAWLPLAEPVDQDPLPDLVYGRWLTEHLGIQEGPEISRALDLLRNAEISGEVANEDEARAFLSQVYLDSD